MRWLGIYACAGVFAIVACGTQIPTATGDDADASAPIPDASVVADPNTADGGKTPESDADAGLPPPTGGNGPIDPCSTSYAPGAKDVFVTESGSSDADCGATTKPCSLAAAIAKKPQTINIGNGTYATAVTLADTSIRIFGGWEIEATTWKRTCEAGKVSIVSPFATGLEIRNSAVTLAYIDVSSKPIAGPGETLFGMMVTDKSRVTLDHVAVKAAPGGAGKPADAQPPAATALNCNPGGGNGVAGGPGANGTNGAISFHANGIGAVLASAGQPGAPGQPGTPGGPPIPLEDEGINCAWTGVIGGQAVPQLDPPTVEECKAIPCSHVINLNRGASGCGGAGGFGGPPGHNGGSSIGLFVSGRSTVSVVSGTLSSSNGGAGTSGSPGSKGAPPTDGKAGDPIGDPNCNSLTSTCFGASDVECASGVKPYEAPGGAKGGPGGAGGLGGTGGMGAGGHSYGRVLDSTSSIEVDEDAITIGAPGAGAGPAVAAKKATF